MTTDNKTPSKPRQLSAREEAMNAVAASRNADFESETGIKIEPNEAVVDPDIDPEHAAAEAERARLEKVALEGKGGDDDAAQQQLQQQQQDDAAQAQRKREEDAAAAAKDVTERAQTSAGIDPKGKYTLKVNGRDLEVTGEEVLRRAQKDTSADQRLEEANRVMREAQSLQQTLQQQQQADEAARTAKAAGGNPDGVVVDPDITNEFTAALFKGDAETAAKAFNKAVSSAVAAAQADNKGRSQAATPVDPSAIAAQVRQQINIDSALDQSRKDYPDLYADPDIEAVAASRIERKVKEGKPFVAALDEVQGEFATKFGWKKQGTGTLKPQPPSNRREEKLERKAALETPVGGPNVKTGSSEEQPQASVSDTIREIAKARGQTAVS